MGWLSGYKYRKQIPITGATGAEAGYQIPLRVIKKSGTDSNGVVYLNEHALDFPDDIRFTTDDGNTELYHAIEQHIPSIVGTNARSYPTQGNNIGSTAFYHDGKTFYVYSGVDATYQPVAGQYVHSTKTVTTVLIQWMELI